MVGDDVDNRIHHLVGIDVVIAGAAMDGVDAVGPDETVVAVAALEAVVARSSTTNSWEISPAGVDLLVCSTYIGQ